MLQLQLIDQQLYCPWYAKTNPTSPWWLQIGWCDRNQAVINPIILTRLWQGCLGVPSVHCGRFSFFSATTFLIHLSDVTRRRHGCLESFHQTLECFIQNLDLVNNREIIKALHYWPFVRVIRRSPMASLHKRPETRKAFPCHDFFMTRIVRKSPGGRGA